MTYIVFSWFTTGLLTAIIASAKGRSFLNWLALGFAGGIFAMTYVAFAPGLERQAPMAPTPLPRGNKDLDRLKFYRPLKDEAASVNHVH